MLNEGKFPSEDYKRKVILVLSRKNYMDIKHIQDENHLKSHPNILVISLEDCIAYSNIRDCAEPGNVLIQNPFEKDKYNVSDTAISKFSIDKHHITSRLFQLLGCKMLEIEQIEVIDENWGKVLGGKTRKRK